MKRQAVVLIAALAAALAVGIAVIGSGAAQQPGPPTGTLDLVLRGRESTLRYVDNPPRGGDPERPSPGDLGSSEERFATLRIGGSAGCTRSS